MGIPVKSDGNQLCYKNGLEFNILKFIVFFKKIGFSIFEKYCSQNVHHAKNEVSI